MDAMQRNYTQEFIRHLEEVRNKRDRQVRQWRGLRLEDRGLVRMQEYCPDD